MKANTEEGETDVKVKPTWCDLAPLSIEATSSNIELLLKAPLDEDAANPIRPRDYQ